MEHLTDQMVGALPLTPNSESRYEIYDASVENLAVRVGARNKTFVLVARFDDSGDTKRRMLGRFPEMKTEAARVEAHRWNELLKQGINPATEVEKARKAEELRVRSTFASVMQDYLAYIPSRPSNLGAARETYFINHYILDPTTNPWLNRPISEIEDADVSSLVKALNTRAPTSAFKCFRTLKTFFRWAMDPEYRRKIGLQHNPIEFTTADRLGLVAYERDRVFEYEETHAYLIATAAIPYPHGPCLRVLIETGQRIGVVSAMRWSQLNLERKLWIIPGTRSKRAKPGRTSKDKFSHKVPLSDRLVRLLLALQEALPPGHGDFVFSFTGGQTPVSNFSNLKRDRSSEKSNAETSSKKSKDETDVAKGLINRLMAGIVEGFGVEYEPWVWHDVRRTVRTHLEAITGRTEVAEAAIGHGQTGIVRVYNLHKYRAEIRKGFNAWSELLRKTEEGTCTIADWEHDPEATEEPRQ
ncbi:integrase arm-type DNA-binding domain-containing protein [Rhizobium ruizarguesonis]